MSPVIDTIGSVKAYGWGVFLSGSSYESISTYAVTSNVNSVTFSNIPSSYKHLQLRVLHKNSATGKGGNNLELQFNDDTGYNYTHHFLRATGRTNVVDAGVVATMPWLTARTTGVVPSYTGGSNVFTCGIIDILDYANTSKNKVMRTFINFETNNEQTPDAEDSVGHSSSVWLNTSAITKIKLFNGNNSYDLVTNSHFALYGIKG
jgi:hypothetical protein